MWKNKQVAKGYKRRSNRGNLWKDKEKNNEYHTRVEQKYSITISKVNETEMIQHLEAHRPVNSYLKNLIRKDMESEATKKDK